MDKAKTLEVLRGMKFMQRKEEAKRRATFEVAQRDEIERQLLRPGGDGGSGDATGARRGHGAGSAAAPARAKILYDDCFPTNLYSLSRRSFTETLGDAHDDPLTSSSIDGAAQLDGGAIEQAIAPPSSSPRTHTADDGRNRSAGTSEDDSTEIEDLWGGEDDEAEDPTAAPTRRHARRTDASREGERSDGRFVVQSSVRAPKLPRRLQETVEEEERQRKRRRAEEQEGGL